MEANHHVIKCYFEYFGAVWLGVKTFEVRLNDRNYKVGDTVIMVETNVHGERVSDRIIEFEISYLLENNNQLRTAEVVVMGFRGILNYTHWHQFTYAIREKIRAIPKV